MKKKSNKSKFDRGRFFFAVLLHWRCRDCVWGTVFFQTFFFTFRRSNCSLSLSRSTQFLCVCAFFFLEAVESATTPWAMERGRSCFPFTGFFPDITSYFVFFLLAQFIGLFFPEFFPVPAVLMRPGWTFVKTLPWQPLMACPLRNAMELSGQYFDWRFQWRRCRLILRAFYGLCVESSGNVSRLWWSSKGLSVWFS